MTFEPTGGLKNLFSCNVSPVSGQRPTSVHALRPQDIEVIAALGDSLTVISIYFI